MQHHTRYAIYFAPKKESDLNQFGRTWLAGDMHSSLKIDGISDKQMADVITPAARYGFHGTLKPPFHLTSSNQESLLIKDLKTFVSNEKPFLLPALKLSRIGRFLALAPQQQSFRMQALSERCVRFFDPYRQPESESQMNKRRKPGLNIRQENYLVTWGYPYIFKEFKFHLTLTGPIIDKKLKTIIFKELEKRLRLIHLDGIIVASVCLFIQEGKEAPFLLHSRYEF